MAIDMTTGTAGHVSNITYSPRMYKVERVVNFADVVTTKGSAIAQGDVIQAVDLPAGSLLMFAGMEVTEAMSGTSTDTALDLGITGGNVDAFVDGFDFDGASAGDYASAVGYYTAQTGPILVTSDDTLDILIQAQTGTITGGKIRVWAVLIDVSAVPAPGTASAGS